MIKDKILAFLFFSLFCVFPHTGKSQGTVTDVDGNTYRTVKIGGQEWMAENLRTTRYNDGTSLFTGLSNYAWSITTEGAYAVYPHDKVLGISSRDEMVDAYGKLYNWYAVVDYRGICPVGWRIPNDDDWGKLVEYLKNTYDLTNEWEDVKGVGNSLKACWQVDSTLTRACGRYEHPRWSYSPNHFGTDEFGFSGLPAGGRYIDGSYNYIGNAGLWWSTTGNSVDFAWGRLLGYFHGGVYRFSGNKKTGFSVRCVKH